MMRKLLPLTAALFCFMALTACVNLKPVPSETESFTLGPVEMVSKSQNVDTPRAIYIMRPQIPTYLDGSRLSFRSASGEVKSMPGTRWAEPLAEGIARAMSLYLSETGLGAVEGYYPWPNASPGASRLSLYFQRFGATDSGEVQVLARWSLKQADGQTISGQYLSQSLNWSVGQPDSLIKAYNESLRALSRAIEARVTQP